MRYCFLNTFSLEADSNKFLLKNLCETWGDNASNCYVNSFHYHFQTFETSRKMLMLVSPLCKPLRSSSALAMPCLWTLRGLWRQHIVIIVAASRLLWPPARWCQWQQMGECIQRCEINIDQWDVQWDGMRFKGGHLMPLIAIDCHWLPDCLCQGHCMRGSRDSLNTLETLNNINIEWFSMLFWESLNSNMFQAVPLELWQILETTRNSERFSTASPASPEILEILGATF